MFVLRVARHVAIAAALCGVTYAGPIAVVNPSFESPDVPSFNAGPVDSWDINGGTAGVFNPTDTPPGTFFTDPVPDGDQTLYLNASATVGQWLAATLDDSMGTLGTRYTLEVDVGRRNDAGGPLAYSAQLVADTGGVTVLASGGHATVQPALGRFATLTLVYDALFGNPLAGDTLGIRFINFGSEQVNFDNVRLTAAALNAGTAAPVPEPGTLALLGLAVCGAYAIRRRRRCA